MPAPISIDIDQLVGMYVDGKKTVKECADNFSVSVDTVRRRLNSAGVSVIRRSGYAAGDKNSNWRGGAVIVHCCTCGKPKKMRQSYKDAAKMHFCGHECYGLWRSKNIRGEKHGRWKGLGPDGRRLHQRISSAIRDTITGKKNGRKWQTLVGYTLADIRQRLKETMPDGYSWQDFLNGDLHIDHIVPVSAFNFSKPEHDDFGRCWSLSNLQLLPAKENIKKWANLERPFQPHLKLETRRI